MRPWVKLAWSLFLWPCVGLLAATADGGIQIVAVIWMVLLGLVLEGLRFVSDRLNEEQIDAIALRDAEIKRLRPYRDAYTYATNIHRKGMSPLDAALRVNDDRRQP